MVLLNACKRYAEAQKLPPGHIEKKKAAAALSAEYGDCLNQENTWLRGQLHFQLLSLKQALWVSREASKLLGYYPPNIKIDPSIFDNGAGGCWSPVEKAILFCSRDIGLACLAHEMTHYFIDRDRKERRKANSDCQMHGDYFCQTEIVVFDAIDEVLKQANT